MALATDFRSAFLMGDRERGQDYYELGHVRSVVQTADSISARVRGSGRKEYRVTLDLKRSPRGDLGVNCECPRFHDGFYCKHIWATILAVDNRDLVSRPGLKSADNGSDGDDDEPFRVVNRDVGPSRGAGRPANAGRDRRSAWSRGLEALWNVVLGRSAPAEPPSLKRLVTECPQRLWWAISLDDSLLAERLCFVSYVSKQQPDGQWSIPTLHAPGDDDRAALVDPLDQQLVDLLQDADQFDNDEDDEDEYDKSDYFDTFMDYDESYDSNFLRRHESPSAEPKFYLPSGLHNEVLPRLAETGRFVWMLGSEPVVSTEHPVAWDAGPEWRLVVSIERDQPQVESGELTIRRRLVRGDERAELDKIVMAFSDGLVLYPDHLARLLPGHARWVEGLVQAGEMRVPESQLDEFMTTLLQLPSPPEIEFDAALGCSVASGQPRGRLELQRPEFGDQSYLQAKVSFKYGDGTIGYDEPRGGHWDAPRRQLILRNPVAERELLQSLSSYRFQSTGRGLYEDEGLWVRTNELVNLVAKLAPLGWEVFAEKQLIRQAGRSGVQVTSGVDWFDVELQLDFDGMSVSLPQLLTAIRLKQRFVTLDDGSQGVLPTEWLDQFERLADLGQEGEQAEGGMRFHRSQALLLDALLAGREGVSADLNFTQLCQQLRNFSGIKPARIPRGFQGQLRPYQAEGLAWFGFLRDFEFGGCLADDMGLGKTVQVLALLLSRRTRRLAKDETRRPSIVVVPKSLVFNWADEARKFAPRLRIVNHTGIDRDRELAELDGADIVLTTYGTLRRDIETLSAVDYDYAILDEAQAIKNSASQTAKACRLLKARYRLAMTGTPVENHLGELWSLLEFLNPSLLGSSTMFRRLARSNGRDPQTLEMIREATRPFILRRTKAQVLTDLPEKTEQTIFCEMAPKQRKLYGEMRDYFRAQVTKQVDKLGIRRSKIHVLEALLRLRQAACDPRLLDDTQAMGAKLQTLCELVAEVLDEGHKALVFSQFTSLLALVRQEFDKRGWVYEYLDGKTNRRADRVSRFQTDEDCRLFLISLKAGGHGLNLTAADYVFILDPWWNPAVEAQAIDRTHRIGQTRQVMAYRIICRETVEEKIIELQNSKRDLADAIVGANESLISQLTADDLAYLLG